MEFVSLGTFDLIGRFCENMVDKDGKSVRGVVMPVDG